MDQVFGLANMFAAAGWLLLLAAPRWRWTERLVLSGWWSLALAVLYTALIARFFPQSEGGFGSIPEVRQLFASDALLTAGWVHYLAFDLYVGAMQVKQAQRDQLSHLVLIPVLIATFLLGPMGMLAFFVVRSIRRGQAVEVTA